MPHTWRTRKDPFVEVWGQIQLQVDINPSRTAKKLFKELQQRYPGKFPDGQLRTFQRRVKERRRELMMYSSQSTEAPWTNLTPQVHSR